MHPVPETSYVCFWHGPPLEKSVYSSASSGSNRANPRPKESLARAGTPVVVTFPRRLRYFLHGAVHLEAKDRDGLERLLRYCARPAFVSERHYWDGRDQPVRCNRTMPLPSGQTELGTTPIDLLDRLAALPPPKSPAACDRRLPARA